MSFIYKFPPKDLNEMNKILTKQKIGNPDTIKTQNYKLQKTKN